MLPALNRNVDAETLLGALGIVPRDSALPTRADCPLCGGALNLYEDTISGGLWHYCLGCRHAGDSLSLACAAWKVDLEGAIRRLNDRGARFKPTPELLSSYTDYHAAQEKVEAFWINCRKRLAAESSVGVARLKARLRVESSLVGERWTKGPGAYLGSVSRNGYRALVELWGKRGLPLGDEEAILVAFHSMPGRLCGLLAAHGRDGLSYVGSPASGDTAKTREGGLAFMDTLRHASKTTGNYAVVLDDAFLAARLQTRNFSSSDRPLPLVAFRHDSTYVTRRAYDVMNGLRPVFWNYRLTAPIVHQAILTDGLVAVTRLEHSDARGLDDYVRMNQPVTIVQKAIKKAVGWKQALATWSETATADHVLDMVLALESYGIQKPVLRSLSEPLDTAVGREPVRRVKVNRFTIVERDGRWYHQNSVGSLDLVMNAVLRITGVTIKDVTFEKKGLLRKDVVHYCCQLIHEGDTISFEAPADSMTHRCCRILQNVLGKAKQKLLYVNGGFSRRLVDAAKLFCPMP